MGSEEAMVGTHDVDWLAGFELMAVFLSLSLWEWSDRCVLSCTASFHLLKPTLVNYYPACFSFLYFHFPFPPGFSSFFQLYLPTFLSATLQRPPTQILVNSNLTECLGWNNQPSWFRVSQVLAESGISDGYLLGTKAICSPRRITGKTRFCWVGHCLISQAQNYITNMD